MWRGRLGLRLLICQVNKHSLGEDDSCGVHFDLVSPRIRWPNN